MLVVKTPDDVDHIRSGECFFIQCPRTKAVYRMTQLTSSRTESHYMTAQAPNMRGNKGILVNLDSDYYRGISEYHFTKEAFKEIIQSKRFIISGVV